jgi:hypothetical protein
MEPSKYNSLHRLQFLKDNLSICICLLRFFFWPLNGLTKSGRDCRKSGFIKLIYTIGIPCALDVCALVKITLNHYSL